MGTQGKFPKVCIARQRRLYARRERCWPSHHVAPKIVVGRLGLSCENDLLLLLNSSHV